LDPRQDSRISDFPEIPKIRHILREKKEEEKELISPYLDHRSAFFLFFLFCFFFPQFCDVVIMAIIPRVDLVTFGYRPAKKVEMY